MSKETGGPAFPTKILTDELYQDDSGYEHRRESFETGMTLRDYFAAKAMQGILASYSNQDNICDANACAVEAYKRADAMLAERSKEEK